MYRVCHPHNFGQISFDEAHQRFTGPTAAAFTELMTFLLKGFGQLLKMNATVVVQSRDLGVGEYDAKLKRYNGCLGEIQMNRSDFMLQLTNYPKDIDNVAQGIVVKNTKLWIGSMYNKTEVGPNAQILSSFESFSAPLWFLCFFTCLVIFFIAKLRYVVVHNKRTRGRRNCYIAYKLVTHCLRLDQMRHSGVTQKLLFTCASLFSLIVVHYFCSFIKTELVVIKSPLIFSSYRDMIERKAMPMFLEGSDFMSYFNAENSPQFRQELWRYAIKNYKMDEMRVEATPGILIVVFLALMSQSAVNIADDVTMSVFPTMLCNLASRNYKTMIDWVNLMYTPEGFDQMKTSLQLSASEEKYFHKTLHERDHRLYSEPQMLVHVTSDEKEQAFIQGLLYNAHMARPLRDALGALFAIILESGLFLGTMRVLFMANVLMSSGPLLDALYGPNQSSRSHLVHRCKSETIFMPDVGFHPLVWQNYLTLFALVASVYCFLLLLLAVEMWLGRRRSMRSQHKMRRRRRGVPTHRMILNPL